MAAEYTYHILSYPWPEDFVAWYPYIRPDVMKGSPQWLRWLQRVIAGDTPGLNDRFVAARRTSDGRWVGVVWASVSETAPEIAHFGWFYIEEDCRGGGVGGRIVETYLNTLAAEGVRAVMLPTHLSNERAIGMYYRRGWQLSITDPAGGVWMVREPQGFYESYFTPDPARPLRAGEAVPADYVALDYLLSRPAAPIRLLPLGLVGNRRFVSFCHDWETGYYMVARQEGRPMALAVALPAETGMQVDVFGLTVPPMAAALRALLERASSPYALVAVGDTRRREAVEAAGMRMESTTTQTVAGEPLGLCRYVP
ncbi:MAG: GNAT family N-acetyltransferase [Armatimonadetes bacterium]|nr:GNAT family N-acetyltransferase [Armatimonadota bacterium]